MLFHERRRTLLLTAITNNDTLVLSKDGFDIFIRSWDIAKTSLGVTNIIQKGRTHEKAYLQIRLFINSVLWHKYTH